MIKLTGQELARLLWEEFDAGFWGKIDPEWFQEVADGDGESDDVVLLGQLLQRVVERLGGPVVVDDVTALPPPPEGHVRVQVNNRVVTVPRSTTGRAILLASGHLPPDQYVLLAKTPDGKTTTRISPEDGLVCDGGSRFITMSRSQTGG